MLKGSVWHTENRAILAGSWISTKERGAESQLSLGERWRKRMGTRIWTWKGAWYLHMPRAGDEKDRGCCEGLPSMQLQKRAGGGNNTIVPSHLNAPPTERQINGATVETKGQTHTTFQTVLCWSTSKFSGLETCDGRVVLFVVCNRTSMQHAVHTLIHFYPTRHFVKRVEQAPQGIKKMPHGKNRSHRGQWIHTREGGRRVDCIRSGCVVWGAFIAAKRRKRRLKSLK